MVRPFKRSSNYHPSIETHSWIFNRIPLRGQSARKVQQRLLAIMQKVDFENKLVIDLGCSGGYFSFKLAEKAKYVWAIDADAQIIEQNKIIASKHNYQNISFICDLITSNLIESLPQVDITLFLSVYHHILTTSQAYSWNQIDGEAEAMDLIPAVSNNSQNLVFEMGYPDEGYEWCSRLPPMFPSPQAWINEMLSEWFNRVDFIQSPVYSGYSGKLRQFISKQRFPNHKLERAVRRLMAIDPRDARDIYIASHR